MINSLNTKTNTTTTITIDAKNHKMDDNHGTLLSLPQCDLERPEEEASGSIGKNSSFGIGMGEAGHRPACAHLTASLWLATAFFCIPTMGLVRDPGGHQD